MTRFRLSAVLRARKAQEDAAKAAVVQARAEATEAVSRVEASERNLDGRTLAPQTTPTAFVATMMARQALASALNTAIDAARIADETVAQQVSELTDAAVQRRTIEKLAERHAEARRRTEDAAEVRAVDDLTTVLSHRPGEPSP